MIEHTTRAFDADLQSLTLKIAEMSRLSESQIRQSIEALVNCDVALAESVVAADDRVDALQREIEEKAIVTIARRQPMAVDLREIVGALRISNDLERIGDLAENVAKVPLLADAFRIEEVILQLQRMARMVLDQLTRVLESYERRDAAEALEVWRNDLEVDSLNNSLFRESLTYMMEDPRNITFCTHLLFCAKNIERIGDHATNIAETVYYIVEGRTLSERPKADLTSIAAPPPRQGRPAHPGARRRGADARAHGTGAIAQAVDGGYAAAPVFPPQPADATRFLAIPRICHGEKALNGAAGAWGSTKPS
jgi:phosphate transport system protein